MKTHTNNTHFVYLFCVCMHAHMRLHQKPHRHYKMCACKEDTLRGGQEICNMHAMHACNCIFPSVPPSASPVVRPDSAHARIDRIGARDIRSTTAAAATSAATASTKLYSNMEMCAPARGMRDPGMSVNVATMLRQNQHRDDADNCGGKSAPPPPRPEHQQRGHTCTFSFRCAYVRFTIAHLLDYARRSKRHERRVVEVRFTQPQSTTLRLRMYTHTVFHTNVVRGVASRVDVNRYANRARSSSLPRRVTNHFL